MRQAEGSLRDTVGFARRNRKALLTTNALENAIAAAAIVGDSSTPSIGCSTPAATGIRSTFRGLR